MDKSERENIAFIIFKSIIVFISLFIAGFLIALFCAVSKVDAQEIPFVELTIYHTRDLTGQQLQIGNNGIPTGKVGSLDSRFNITNGSAIEPNKTYNVDWYTYIESWEPSAIQWQMSYVSFSMYAMTCSGNNCVWNNLSPTRYEIKEFEEIADTGVRKIHWAFELDSTLWSNNIRVTMRLPYPMYILSFSNLALSWFRLYIAEISPPTDNSQANGTTQAIEKQTQTMTNNDNNNTNRVTGAIETESEKIQDKLNDINNNMNNDNISSGYGSGLLNGISSNAGNGLAGVINAPLGVLGDLVSNGNSCTDIDVPLPFVNRNLTLPCLTPIYQSKFGAFFNIYQAIITGIIAYWVSVNIFLKTKKMSMPDDDRIEVLDL